jgi:hypothetical protein
VTVKTLGLKKKGKEKDIYPRNAYFRLPLYQLFLGILNILSQKLAKYTEKSFSIKCVSVGFHLFCP